MKKLKLIKITTTVVSLPTDVVMVENYKCKPAVWEKGVVYDTKIAVDQNGGCHKQYRVALDRRSPKGNVLILYVGDDGIKPVFLGDNY